MAHNSPSISFRAIALLTAVLVAAGPAAADHAPFSFGDPGHADDDRFCIGWSCLFHTAPDTGRDRNGTADHRVTPPTGERGADGVADHRTRPILPPPRRN